MAVLATNIYRAVTQSLTIDEAFTYNDYVAVPWEQARHHVDPNNHVLNTLLAKATVRWWGPSEWAIRAPSLAGGAIYLLSSLGLVALLFGSTWTAALVFSALVLNPIILDYLSAARGYSLALGLLFFATYLMARVILKPSRKLVNVLLHAGMGIALGLSIAANLTFAIPDSILVAFYLGLPWIMGRTADSDQAGLNAGLIFAAAGITFGELMFGTFEGANASTFSIGEASLARSIYILFLRCFQFPTVPGGRLLPPLLAVVTGPILIACLAAVLFSAFRRRDDQPKPDRSEVLLLFPLTLVASAAALIALHYIIGLPYPYERTGLYFLPLMTLTVASAALLPQRLISRPALFFLSAVTIQYLLELKTSWYEEWVFDAGTKRAMLALTHAHETHPSGNRMGISWMYEQSVLYYANVDRMDWLARVTREDPHSGDFDYYYLAEQDQDVVAQKKLVILYRDPASNAVLARK